MVLRLPQYELEAEVDNKGDEQMPLAGSLNNTEKTFFQFGETLDFLLLPFMALGEDGDWHP
jgi:hypothetical protein